MSATPKPKVRPVTRWAVAYQKWDGSYFMAGSVWYTREEARVLVRDARIHGNKARAIRVRITVVESKPKKRSAKR